VDHIERLRAEIALKRSALAEQRAEVNKLQAELALFAEQYTNMVGPLEAELDKVRQEIESHQRPKHSNTSYNAYTSGSIWGEYGSFEEAFDAKYRRNTNEPIIPKKAKKQIDTEEQQSELRTLYRKLARKYHPDTTTDPAEKARLTLLMAQINAAYRAKNLDELYVLDGRAPNRQTRIETAMPNMNVVGVQETYLDLLEQARKLDDDILAAKIDYQNIMTSPLMSLKIEASIARSKGRNLLREIAAKVREDLTTARRELTALRGY
jgi:uncharacterized coiled-coil protein SlyX